MNKTVILSILLILFINAGFIEQNPYPSDLGDLFIGTLKRGNTVSATTAPFGMISCGTDNVFTETRCARILSYRLPIQESKH